MHSTFHEIREATRVVQARIESGPFERAVLDGTLTAERRASFLRALHAVYTELESAVVASTVPAVRNIQPPLAAKRAQLEHELRDLRADLRHVDAAVLRALVLGQSIRRDAARSQAALIGHIYVLEASQLRFLLRAPELATSELEAALTKPTDVSDATAGAEHALRGLEAMLDVVLSSQLEDQLAGALNSEAGTHPVPADVREVRAALAAGEETWNTWRYYEARYGERGLRFTRSDSAWLVTLAREEPESARRQIAWLGRVLATRGMPQILLEQHLQQLHGRLTAALPDHAASYQPLRAAAEELARQRRAVLSDADGERIARQFAASAPAQSPVGSLEIGRLLVGAAVDETCGIAQAVDSLMQWLDDPARFPDALRSQLAPTLSAARAACKKGGAA